MNLNNTVAIDFGYTRTKMAYYNSSQDQVQVMELDEDLRYIYTNDVAIIEETGVPVVGVEFERALESELDSNSEKYIIIQGFKARIKRAIMGQSGKSQEVLTAIFKKLWEKAHGHRAFNAEEPIRAYLTYTPLYDDQQISMLKRAAEEAGFKDVQLVTEPQAIIRAFQAEGGTPPKHQLIMDCGGWTLDICYLHSHELEFKPISEQIGGREVDTALIKCFQERHENELKNASVVLEKGILASLRRQIRLCKEQYSSEGGRWDLIKVHTPKAGNPLLLPLEEEDFIKSAQPYINKVCRNVMRTVEQIDKKMVKEADEKRLSIELVGGSSQLRGLKKTLEDKLKSDFGDKFEITISSTSHSTEYAAVRGALQPTVAQGNRHEKKDADTPPTGDTDQPHTDDTIPAPEGMVLIDAGEFRMGSNHEEASNDEQPVHTVYVDSFYMDIFPVTNAQYKAFIDENPQWQKVKRVYKPDKPWLLFLRFKKNKGQLRSQSEAMERI